MVQIERLRKADDFVVTETGSEARYLFVNSSIGSCATVSKQLLNLVLRVSEGLDPLNEASIKDMASEMGTKTDDLLEVLAFLVDEGYLCTPSSSIFDDLWSRYQNYYIDVTLDVSRRCEIECNFCEGAIGCAEVRLDKISSAISSIREGFVIRQLTIYGSHTLEVPVRRDLFELVYGLSTHLTVVLPDSSLPYLHHYYLSDLAPCIDSIVIRIDSPVEIFNSNALDTLCNSVAHNAEQPNLGLCPTVSVDTTELLPNIFYLSACIDASFIFSPFTPLCAVGKTRANQRISITDALRIYCRIVREAASLGMSTERLSQFLSWPLSRPSNSCGANDRHLAVSINGERTGCSIQHRALRIGRQRLIRCPHSQLEGIVTCTACPVRHSCSIRCYVAEFGEDCSLIRKWMIFKLECWDNIQDMCERAETMEGFLVNEGVQLML